MSLLITKAKPNPAGKDRLGRVFTPVTQLAAEWIDFQNTTKSPININEVQMYHIAYLQNGSSEWELVTDLSGTLPAGEIVRIHSGNPIPLTQMNPEDRVGVNYHIFTGKNYVWNNNRIDKPSLWYKPIKQWIDQAEYNPPVGEGRILQRINNKLI